MTKEITKSMLQETSWGCLRQMTIPKNGNLPERIVYDIYLINGNHYIFENKDDALNSWDIARTMRDISSAELVLKFKGLFKLE